MTTSRRKFIRQSLVGAGTIMAASSFSSFRKTEADIQVSLAEWSFHRALESGKMDHLDFPARAKNEFGITAVEYVNGFFGGKKMDFKEAAKNQALPERVNEKKSGCRRRQSFADV